MQEARDKEAHMNSQFDAWKVSLISEKQATIDMLQSKLNISTEQVLCCDQRDSSMRRDVPYVHVACAMVRVTRRSKIRQMLKLGNCMMTSLACCCRYKLSR
jgi:hypothetical protein